MDDRSEEVQAISCWPPESPDCSPPQSPNTPPKQEPSQSPPYGALKRAISRDPIDSCASKKKRFNAQPDPHDDIFAEMALVKWWKKQVRENVIGDGNCDPSLGAYSKMDMITRSPAGQKFLRDQLNNLLTSHPRTDDPHILAVIGSYQDKLGEYEDAHASLTKAVNSHHQEAEVEWLLARVRKQLEILLAQRRLLQCPQSLQQAFPTPCPVDRVHEADLSFTEFFTKYAMTHTPVIITGLQVTQTPWTLAHIKHKAGFRSVTPKRLVPGSIEWAKLENAPTTTVAEYIDALPPYLECKNHPLLTHPEYKQHPTKLQHPPEPEKSNQEHNSDNSNLCGIIPARAKPENMKTFDPEERAKDSLKHTYLFDWSLPQYAPELVEEVIIPRYFAGDLLQNVSKGSLYRDSWPSLFIAPAGLRSELHVDTFGSNFWMALLQGKKRWVFFGREDLPLLYPRYPHSMDPCFDVDLSCPDLETFPLLANTTPRECILQEGDVLFVPSGCPHYVENVSQSIAISANFVDPSNLDLVVGELGVAGLQDPRALDLHYQLIKTAVGMIGAEGEGKGERKEEKVEGKGEEDGEGKWDEEEWKGEQGKGEEKVEGKGEEDGEGKWDEEEWKGEQGKGEEGKIETEGEEKTEKEGEGKGKKEGEGKGEEGKKTEMVGKQMIVPEEDEAKGMEEEEAEGEGEGVEVEGVREVGEGEAEKVEFKKEQTHQEQYQNKEQKQEQYQKNCIKKKLSPQVQKWIESVERKGDLKWHEFKNNGVDNLN